MFCEDVGCKFFVVGGDVVRCFRLNGFIEDGGGCVGEEFGLGFVWYCDGDCEYCKNMKRSGE